MPKTRTIRSVDLPSANPFDAGPALATTASMAPPVQAAIGHPTNLQLTTTIERNAVTPTAQIGATWYPPAGVAPSGYIVQWSLSSSFPDPGTTGQAADGQASTIRGLTPATLYYVRVAAVAGGVTGSWSDTASITTAADTTPPDPPTSPAGTFTGIGDLIVTWVNPASANFRDVEVVIKASSGGATLATLYNATQQQIWTAAQNLAATSGAGDGTVYVELRARSWGGIFSTSVNTGTVTKAAPTAPGVSVDFTGADAIYTITAPSDAARLSFVADTGVTARFLPIGSRYAYTFDTNRVDHSGTADPSLAYSFTATDGLNQASSATSGTATNAAPSAPTVNLIGGQNQLVGIVTSAPAADFLSYEYVWKKDGATVLTVESAQSQAQYAAQAGDEGLHSWTVTVRQKDVFAQYSSATVSSTVILDALTVEYLREGLLYTDSVGNSIATLSVLKDDNTVSGGVSYAA